MPVNILELTRLFTEKFPVINWNIPGNFLEFTLIFTGKFLIIDWNILDYNREHTRG